MPGYLASKMADIPPINNLQTKAYPGAKMGEYWGFECCNNMKY
jgi:hypothetical protein